MRTFIVIMCITILCITFSSCDRYNEEWILGKTKEEVSERYGEFLREDKITDEDGKYSCSLCYYQIEPTKRGVFGDMDDFGELLKIKFNDEGIAILCQKIPDGIGG